MSLIDRQPQDKQPAAKKPAPKPKTPAKPQRHPMSVVEWPKKRLPEGIGISFKDGWNFGMGFGLAMAIAVPIILALLGCVIMTAFGSTLGALF